MMRASTKRVTTLGFCLLCVMLASSLVYQAEGQYYDFDVSTAAEPEGCTDKKADNYDPEAYEDDGSCEYSGCTDRKADNYDRNADTDDGSCEYSGCTDRNADNYDRKADTDDGSCEYSGCTDRNADNYDRKADTDDGSCEYSGCTDRKADNYDRKADKDDGSCEYSGCTDRKADNYDRKADTDDGSCEYPVPVVVPGCLDPTANNFDIRATVDDGSCDFSVRGCTSVNAVNFNPAATQNDGSCIQPREPVEDDVDVEEPLPEPECSSEDETCCDIQPPSSVYSCEEEKNFGKCGENWMQGYCAFTCGRCGQSKLRSQRIEVRMKEAKQMRVVMEAEQMRAKRLWREVEESEVQKWEEGICEKLAGCCKTYGKKECAKACRNGKGRKGKVNLPKDEAELERMRGVLVEDLTGKLDQCGANQDQVLDIADESQVKVCKQIPGCCSDPSVDPKQCVRACNEVKKRSGSRRCDAAPDLVKELAMDNQIIDELQAQEEKNEEERILQLTEVEKLKIVQEEKVNKEAESAQKCQDDYFQGATVCKERAECDLFCNLLENQKNQNPAYKKALDEEEQKEQKKKPPGLYISETLITLSREEEKKFLKNNIMKSIEQRKTDGLKDVSTSIDMKKKEVNDAAKNSRDMLEQKVQQGLKTIQARSNDAAEKEAGAQRERDRREKIRQAAERKAAAAERKAAQAAAQAAQAAAQAERKAAAARGPQGEQPQGAPQGGQLQGEQLQAQAAPQGEQFRRNDFDVNAAGQGQEDEAGKGQEDEAGKGQEDEAGKGQEDAGQGQEDEAAVQEQEVSLTCTYLNGTQFTSRSLNSSMISEVEFTAMELLDFLNVPEEITSTELAGISCAEAEKPKCYPNESNEFVFRVKSVKDQYEVEGCEGMAPTLGMQRGVEYTLVQEDLTNWEQPLGLAYYPGGAPNGVPELEEPTPPECGEEQYLCDPGEGVKEAPLYCVNGTCASSGSDEYQPYFQKSQEEWEAEGPYALKITIPEDSQTIEFYYFSRLHPGKSGKIAVEDTTEDSVPVQEDISPLALLRGGL